MVVYSINFWEKYSQAQKLANSKNGFMAFSADYLLNSLLLPNRINATNKLQSAIRQTAYYNKKHFSIEPLLKNEII